MILYTLCTWETFDVILNIMCVYVTKGYFLQFLLFLSVSFLNI